MIDELTRAQLEEQCSPYICSYSDRLAAKALILAHDAAQRATIARLEAAIEALREKRDQLVCGWNRHGLKFEAVGCCQPIASFEDVYRCADCSTPFHKHCLHKHCADERADLEARLAAVTEERQVTRGQRDEAVAKVLELQREAAVQFQLWKETERERDAARAGLRNLYSIMTGADCDERIALGLATSAVHRLVTERDAARAKVREHEQWESDHQMHTLVSPERMKAFERAEQRVAELEKQKGALYEERNRLKAMLQRIASIPEVDEGYSASCEECVADGVEALVDQLNQAEQRVAELEATVRDHQATDRREYE